MTDNVTYPGAYTLKSMIVAGTDGGNSRELINVSGIVPSFTIVESMLNDSIRGTVEMMDSIGFMEDFPLRGEERVRLEVEDTKGIIRVYDLFCYKVDNVQAMNGNAGLTYTMHFISYQRFFAEKRKITSAFDSPISSIASLIFEDTYKISKTSAERYTRQLGTYVTDQANKDLLVEETTGSFKCIVPSYTATQAMKFLESRAYSIDRPSCSFRFFENADAFYFVSDEYLFEDALKRDKVFTFTYSEAIPKTGAYIEAQLNNMEHLSNPDRFDTFKDIYSGAYKSKVFVIDLLNGEVDLKPVAYDYTKKRDSYFRTLDGQPVVDRHSDDFIENNFNEDNCRRFMVVKDYADDGAGQLRGNQFLPEIVTNRVAYREHLNSVKLNTRSPGRLDITCGDIIYMSIPEFALVGEKPQNKQLSGYYMVMELTRIFERERSYNYYTLVKRDWSEPVDERVNDFLNRGIRRL